MPPFSGRWACRGAFSPHEHPFSQSTQPPTFITPQISWLGGLIKDSYFSTAEMPWTKPVARWIFATQWNRLPRWQTVLPLYPSPVEPPRSAAPPTLPVCPLAAQLSRSGLLPPLLWGPYCPASCLLRGVTSPFPLGFQTDHLPWLTMNKGLGVRATYKDASWKPSPCNALNSALAAPKKRWLARGLDTSTTGLVEPLCRATWIFTGSSSTPFVIQTTQGLKCW